MRRPSAWMVALVGFVLAPLTQADPGEIGIPGTEETVLLNRAIDLGAVAGFTTDWHRAPTATAIPIGSRFDLRVRYREFDDPELIRRTFGLEPAVALVECTGVLGCELRDDELLAEAELDQLGDQTITMRVETVYDAIDLRVVHFGTVMLDVVEYQADTLTMTRAVASVTAMEAPTVGTIDRESQAMVNEQTMDLFFGGSVAALARPHSGEYVTSIDRVLQLDAGVRPAGFAPLVEWRFDGVTRYDALGPRIEHRFEEIGRHTISAGPPHAEVRADFELYSVEMISPLPEPGAVRDGELLTFEARTDPPGFEPRITWLASTKFGSSTPVVGRGPEFSVRFDATWGSDSRWLGVRADDAMFNEDGKLDPPDIQNSSPTQGGRGTTITLTGSGLPTDPDDTCVQLGPDGPGARASSADGTTVVAELTAVHPDHQPAQWIVAEGVGGTNMVSVPGLAPFEAWAFEGTLGPAFETVSPETFTPDPGPPGGPSVVRFVLLDLTDGAPVVIADLDPDPCMDGRPDPTYPPGIVITPDVHFNQTCLPGASESSGHYDCFAAGIPLPPTNNLDEVGDLIAAGLRACFMTQGITNVAVTYVPPGQILVTSTDSLCTINSAGGAILTDKTGC